MEAVTNPTTEELRAKRKRSLGLALLTSLFSKGGTLLVTALVVPKARHVLGEERFGLFGCIQMLLFIVGMTDFGLGAGLTRRLAEAASYGRKEEQQRLFSTGFFVMILASLIFGVAGAYLLCTQSLEVLFGKAVAGHEAEFGQNVWLGLGMFLMLLCLGVFARARDAIQETHVYNRLGAWANFAALIILVVGMPLVPYLWWLVAGMYVPQIVAFIINAGWLMKEKEVYRPRLRFFDTGLAKTLWKEGFALFVMLTVAPMLLREGMRLILGHETNAKVLDLFSILVQLGFYGWGFFIMFSMPMTPSLTEATARGDFSWVRSAYRKAMWFMLLVIIGSPLGFGLLGPRIVDVWMGEDIPLDAATMGAYGIYFASTLWSGVHAMFFTATGCLKKGAWLLGLESVLALIVAWIGIREREILGGVLAAGVFCLLGTGWIHAVLFRRHLSKLEHGSARGA